MGVGVIFAYQSQNPVQIIDFQDFEKKQQANKNHNKTNSLPNW